MSCSTQRFQRFISQNVDAAHKGQPKNSNNFKVKTISLSEWFNLKAEHTAGPSVVKAFNSDHLALVNGGQLLFLDLERIYKGTVLIGQKKADDSGDWYTFIMRYKLVM